MVLTEETAHLRLDAEQFGDTLKEYTGERTKGRHRHTAHLHKRCVDKEKTTGQTKGHGFRHLYAIESEQIRDRPILTMGGRLML